MKRLGIVILAVVLLAGCGYRRVDYTARLSVTMDHQQAVALVQQGFKEGGSNRARSLPVLVTNQYIVRGTSVASADSSDDKGSAADDESVDDSDDVKEVGRRLNFNDIASVLVYERRMRSNKYLIVVRSTRHRNLAKLHSTDLEQAKRFVDALAYLQSGR